MASGEDAKKTFSILDTGVSVDLPDHFCLEKPENHTVIIKLIMNCINFIFSAKLLLVFLQLCTKLILG